MINNKIYLILNPPRDITASVLHAYYTFRELKAKLGNKSTVIISSRGLTELKNLFKPLYPFDFDYNKKGKLDCAYRRSYIFKYFNYYFNETFFVLRIILFLIEGGAGDKTVVYTQNLLSAFWISLILSKTLGVKTIYEVHNLDEVNPFFPKYNFLEKIIKKYTIKNVDHLITLSYESKKEIINRNFKHANKITVIPIGFPPAFKPLNKKPCRKKLGFPLQGKILLYSGLTFSFRNLGFLIKAFNGLKQKKITLVLVGGSKQEIDTLIKQAGNKNSNIIFIGRVDHSTIPLYLNAADSLIIHHTLHGDISAPPQKLFEYMAVNKPIIYPNQSNLNEFLKGNAFSFKPGNQKSFQKAIISSVMNIKEAATKAKKAYLDSRKYTYYIRAEKILKIFSSYER